MNFKCMLALFVLGLACRSTTAIQCHSCTSIIGLDNTEQTSTTGCADASNLGTLTPEADAVCTTTYTEADSTGTVTITRGSDSSKLATKTKPYCISEGETTTCYCSTSNCNSEKFAADRSYECYSCESSHYFDNGCGEKLTPGSTHIRTAKGCSACYKIVRVDEDSSVTYKRGCTRSTNIDDECVHEGGNRQCGCKGNLCNSAEGLKSASVVASIVLSVAAKIFSS